MFNGICIVRSYLLQQGWLLWHFALRLTVVWFSVNNLCIRPQGVEFFNHFVGEFAPGVCMMVLGKSQRSMGLHWPLPLPSSSPEVAVGRNSACELTQIWSRCLSTAACRWERMKKIETSLLRIAGIVICCIHFVARLHTMTGLAGVFGGFFSLAMSPTSPSYILIRSDDDLLNFILCGFYVGIVHIIHCLFHFLITLFIPHSLKVAIWNGRHPFLCLPFY